MGTLSRTSKALKDGVAVTVALAAGTAVSAILSLYAVAPDAPRAVSGSIATTDPVACSTGLR